MTIFMADGTSVTVNEPMPTGGAPTHGIQYYTDSTAGTLVGINWAQVTHITP